MPSAGQVLATPYQSAIPALASSGSTLRNYPLAASRQGNIFAGPIAGLWAGLFGGLGLFIVTMTTTFGSTNWYAGDQQTIADAHLHGQPPLVWVVGDNLGGSIFMLIFIPALSIILSALGAATVKLSQAMRWPRSPARIR